MWQQNNIYSRKTNECPLQKQWLVQMYFLLKYIPLTNSLDYSFRGCKRIFSTSRKVWNSWVNQKTQNFAHAFWNPSCFPWWWINTAFKISRDNSLTNLTIRNSYVGTLGNSMIRMIRSILLEAVPGHPLFWIHTLDLRGKSTRGKETLSVGMPCRKCKIPWRWLLLGGGWTGWTQSITCFVENMLLIPFPKHLQAVFFFQASGGPYLFSFNQVN